MSGVAVGPVVDVWVARAGRTEVEPLLRAALAARLGVDAGAVRLGRSSDGRRRVLGCSGLVVSVAHTPGLVVAAVAEQAKIGVDAEALREGPWRLLPRHALTPRELEGLQREPEHLRNEALLRIWTRKEALLKAAGVGLAVDPREVEVSGPRDAPRVLSVPSRLGVARDWSLADVSLEGCAATLAVRGGLPVVRLRAWLAADLACA